MRMAEIITMSFHFYHNIRLLELPACGISSSEALSHAKAALRQLRLALPEPAARPLARSLASRRAGAQ